MRKKPKWISVACLAALAAAATYGCEKPKPLLAGRPECPHSWSKFLDTTVYSHSGPALIPLSYNQFSLPGAITDIPEFHDCQRLISPTNPDRYVAHAAIFAAFDLDGAYARRKKANPTGLIREQTGRLRRASRSAGAEYSTDESVVSEGVAVAEIVSEGDYPQLGIGRGFNCLFLDGTGTAWSGVMVFVGQKEEKCEGLVPTSTMKLAKLWVRTGGVGTSPTDVPPVGRWDVDAKVAVQLMGIKCDDRWCDIGGQFDFEPRRPAGDATRPKEQRIKGWYDEQRLAEFDPGSGNVTTPGASTATVIPDRELGSYTMPGFEASGVTWLPVARVAMDKGSITYSKKNGFEPVPSSMPMNAMTYVYLCKGDADRCQIPATAVDLRARCVSNPRWWAKTQHGPAAAKYYCVKYRGHPAGFSIPAVVRWRWRANDETIWISCPEGCCETDSFDK